MTAAQQATSESALEPTDRAPDADRLLGIYLADHRAAAAAGLKRVRRFADANEASFLGAAARDVSRQIEEDVATLQEIIDRLGYRASRWKIVAAQGAELLGQLKLNGRLRSYSPLSRLADLELLIAGIQTKESLWQTLGAIAEHRPALGRFDLDDLQRRALDQRMLLESHRAAAARAALAA
jgi:hypothetical protein